MTKFALLCLVIFISQPLFAQQEDPKEIIARYSAAAQKGGDAVKGKLVFESEKANCTKCHNVGRKEIKAGPDLMVIGDKFDRGQIIQSILEPSAESILTTRAMLSRPSKGK